MSICNSEIVIKIEKNEKEAGIGPFFKNTSNVGFVDWKIWQGESSVGFAELNLTVDTSGRRLFRLKK